MTIGHAIVGAAAYATLNHQLGLGCDVAAPVLGAFLGIAPDLVYYVWGSSVKAMTHAVGGWLFWVQMVLIAPGLHVLADLVIHAPILPEPGTNAEYDAEVRLLGRYVVRRDVHYMTGEIALCALGTILWLVGT